MRDINHVVFQSILTQTMKRNNGEVEAALSATGHKAPSALMQHRYKHLPGLSGAVEARARFIMLMGSASNARSREIWPGSFKRPDFVSIKSTSHLMWYATGEKNKK